MVPVRKGLCYSYVNPYFCEKGLRTYEVFQSQLDPSNRPGPLKEINECKTWPCLQDTGDQSNWRRKEPQRGCDYEHDINNPPHKLMEDYTCDKWDRKESYTHE